MYTIHYTLHVYNIYYAYILSYKCACTIYSHTRIASELLQVEIGIRDAISYYSRYSRSVDSMAVNRVAGRAPHRPSFLCTADNPGTCMPLRSTLSSAQATRQTHANISTHTAAITHAFAFSACCFSLYSLCRSFPFSASSFKWLFFANSLSSPMMNGM